MPGARTDKLNKGRCVLKVTLGKISNAVMKVRLFPSW